MGEDQPLPGISTFQTTFFVVLQESGRVWSSTTPAAAPPRNAGQRASVFPAAGNRSNRLTTNVGYMNSALLTTTPLPCPTLRSAPPGGSLSPELHKWAPSSHCGFDIHRNSNPNGHSRHEAAPRRGVHRAGPRPGLTPAPGSPRSRSEFAPGRAHALLGAQRGGGNGGNRFPVRKKHSQSPHLLPVPGRPEPM